MMKSTAVNKRINISSVSTNDFRIKKSINKERLSLLLSLILFVFLAACSSSTENTTENTSKINFFDSSLRSPFSASDYIGMNYEEVDDLLRKAGFDKIDYSMINDIDSDSDIDDGTVVSVQINGMDDYTGETVFEKEADVVITYHNIPKIIAPLSSEEASPKQYMDAGKLFFDAGFLNVETDEVYDLPADKESQTVLSAGGERIEPDAPLPFDGKISSIGHYPVSAYPTTINIDFPGNLIFSKYDVVLTVNGDKIGTLPHGEDAQYKISLPAGSYDLVFSNKEKESVKGSAKLNINSETEVAYQISCTKDEVKVKKTSFAQSLETGQFLMPYNSWHYLRKDYKTVSEELKKSGFSSIKTEATTDWLWAPDKIDSVVRVEIKGNSEFKHDDICNKKDSVTVFYHVSDFKFEQSSFNVTEKETFNLPYTMTSGDPIENIVFDIDNPDVLQRNEDGSFTALIPGTATVTAHTGGETVSTCTVEAAEIIVPIEKLEFSSKEMNISVGRTFRPEYTVIPENANYTDMRVEISNDYIEVGEGLTFYSSVAGDSEISFFQDDRLLGTITVHASLYDIEDLILEESSGEIFIGDTIDLKLKLIPEEASNKGIRIVSSDNSVAEVMFDERGPSAAAIVGKAAGKADISITVPSGNKYVYSLTVNELPPEEITLKNVNPNQKIEVGTPIQLEVGWKPENTSVKELKWTSSNVDVIKVDSDGNLVAVGVGTADITGTHKSGLSTMITLTVEPTPVTGIEVTTNWDESKKMYLGNSFTIKASVIPENATNNALTFSSADESIAKVTEKGIVTAVGIGSTVIKVSSADGPAKTVPVTVSAAPQKFRITWSTSCSNYNHVGYNWSYTFTVNDESFYSGSTIVLDPDDSFSISFTVIESDTDPDAGWYYEDIYYSDDLCKNGRTIYTEVDVSENRGRYSGSTAIWKLNVIITPIN